MLFNSFEYLCFLPIVTVIYFCLPLRLRQYFLLLASYYFYISWKAEYAVLIIASTVVDYFAGLKMGATTVRRTRKFYLYLSLLVNLGLLLTFKYLDFVFSSINAGLQATGVVIQLPMTKLLLPVGISFYTFQTLSYTIDVYQGRREPERDWLIFGVYVAFFPQLVAGPIERSTRLMPQFRQRMAWSFDRLAEGLRWIVWGLFLKVVVADRLANYVDAIYNHPQGQSALSVILATYFFAFQIYGDFAGYSAIAIGSARILGYDLMRNFNAPYASVSVAEFWRRWHISLSSWFRDYLYIPLGGNRVSRQRLFVNLSIVFLVSGLWHGANWTFVVWGGLHGLYIILSIAWPWRVKLTTWAGLDRLGWLKDGLQRVTTFHLICFGWIFFRSDDLSTAWHLITRLTHWNFNLQEILGTVSKFEFVLSVCLLLSLAGMQWLYIDTPVSLKWRQNKTPLRWATDIAMTLAVLVAGVYQYTPFIYFQF